MNLDKDIKTEYRDQFLLNLAILRCLHGHDDDPNDLKKFVNKLIDETWILDITLEELK